jgi:hypothetical protein
MPEIANLYPDGESRMSDGVDEALAERETSGYGSIA